MKSFSYRYATENDTQLILSFIRGLAEYEKMSDLVVATPELLKHWIFDCKKAEVVFALEGEKEVGFALFFHNFSRATAPVFCGCLPILPLSAAAADLNGPALIGTSRASTIISGLAHFLRMSGPSTALTARD